MAEKYKDRSVIKDKRQFQFGDIWKVKDELVTLLPSDRVQNGRNPHYCRTVVIIQNCLENCDEESPIIRIAPLAHRIEFAENFDVLLDPDLPDKKRDGVDTECMVQLQLAQPILKIDLYEKVAEVSQGKKEEIMATILNMVGIDLEDNG